MTLHLKRKIWYPWLFIVLCVVLVPAVLWLAPEKWLETMVPVIAAVAGLTHFLYSQHNHDVKFFHELFTAFNKRYDVINNDLNLIRIRSAGTPLQQADKIKLYDYFNLCAEQYLFHDAGYVDARVWRAWCRGMAIFDADPEIHALWEEELRTGSYYGFSLAVIHQH